MLNGHLLLYIGRRLSGSWPGWTRSFNGDAGVGSIHKFERLRILHGGWLPANSAPSRGPSRGSHSGVWHAESLARCHQEHGETIPTSSQSPGRSADFCVIWCDVI